ncbi:lipid droplet-regulating VLDL assembly factor AUP1 isoform X2 [Octopus bimaculoides]|uniref:lipid droplet-regulating VLDL assembly factor AUP1 isoform X2 n=1 Tax=Octopus bimaculoides TaxID=37653 RepID=UPI0022E2359C|nr:lipid droplet-regulating VLDL assembly factor AUP1 isoform X2 [Octopus bimaculoides]
MCMYLVACCVFLFWLPEGLALIPIIVYFPFGFLLAVVRFFIGLQTLLVSCILPKFSPVRSFILRVMCAVLGFIVIVDEHKRRDEKAKVIVTNHVSSFDHFTTALVYPSLLPSVCELFPTLEWILGWKDFGFKQNKESFLNNVKGFCSSSNIPLLVHPEGSSTNGRYGLLKFCTWPFSLDFPLQPMTLHVSRPNIFQIAVTTLNSRWWEDLFWCLFVPVTWFTIRCLPVMEKPLSVSAEEFSEDVRQKVAADLHLIATDYTTADKAELQKKYLNSKFQDEITEQHQQHKDQDTDLLLNMDAEMRKMVTQVQDVLPNVSIKEITKVLAQTKDVDTTITNILENQSTSENSKPTSGSSPENISNGYTTTEVLPAADTPNVYKSVAFSSSGKVRQQSLEERKNQMLFNARQRYLRKQKLN